MKKTILTLGLVCTLLNACAYKPIIDTAGKSGTFNTDQAKEITNDMQHCKTLAKENTTFVGNIVYWSLSPTMDTKKESLIRKCLTNRGHSVLN
jgi:polyhydroxyalkanoate synthesis regulator phasin